MNARFSQRRVRAGRIFDRPTYLLRRIDTDISGLPKYPAIPMKWGRLTPAACPGSPYPIAVRFPAKSEAVSSIPLDPATEAFGFEDSVPPVDTWFPQVSFGGSVRRSCAATHA